MVGRRTCDQKVADSTPGRGAIKSTRSTQSCIPPAYVNRVPACMAGVRRNAVTCVGWQVTLCDPIWQVTSRTALSGDPQEELYRPLPFTFFYIISRNWCTLVTASFQSAYQLPKTMLKIKMWLTVSSLGSLRGGGRAASAPHRGPEVSGEHCQKHVRLIIVVSRRILRG